MADTITTQSLLDFLDTIGTAPQSMQPKPSFRDLTNQGLSTQEALRQYSINQGTTGTYDRNSISSNAQPQIGTKLTQDPRAIPTEQIPPEVMARQKSPQTLLDAIGQGDGATTEPKKKTDWVKNITAVLAGLGGLGGMTANIIGGIKNSGSPGDSAIKQSGSLLETLAKYDQDAQKTAKDQAKIKMVKDRILNSGADQRTITTSLALADAGYLDDALKNTDRIYQEQQISGAKTQGEIDKLENPKLLEATIKNQTQKDLAKGKTEQQLSDEKRNAQAKTYAELSSRKRTPQEEALYQSVKSELKIKPEVSPDLVYKTYNAANKQATDYNKFYDFGDKVKQLQGFIGKLPEGRIEGNLESALQKYFPNQDFTEYKALIASMKAPAARTILGEVGNLAEKEQENALSMFDITGLTKEEAKAKLALLDKPLEKIVKNRFNMMKNTGEKVIGTDLAKEFVDTGIIRHPDDLYKQLTDNSTATKQSVQKSVPAGAVGKVKNNSDGKMYYYDANKKILGVAE